MTLVLEPQDIGLATGVLGSIRGMGGAVAQALYMSVLQNELKKTIPAYVGPAAIDAGLPESSLGPMLLAAATGVGLDEVPGATARVLEAVTEALKTANVKGFRMVFLCTIPFSVILIVASIFVPNMEQYLHNNVAKRLQRTGDAVPADAADTAEKGTGETGTGEKGTGEKSDGPAA